MFINRPEDALLHMEFSFKSLAKERGLSTEDVFPRNPEVYALYGERLSRTKFRDTQARAVMQRIIRNIGQVTDKDNANGKIISVQAKLCLSRILRRMGEADEAEKHETYLIKCQFKKNPKLIPDYMLRSWFETEGPKDPVSQGLGGTKWLNEKRNVPRYKASERMARVCKRCGKGEGLSFKSMKCSKCLHVYYCSRKCQVEDYPCHESNCAEHAADLQTAESLESTSPEDSKCVHNWTLYKNSTFARDATCYALGLRFNAERGKTHSLIG
ncbi:hypothetical protein VNI00_015574 [Paramarasmius palmivorus]|uniref:MYND-type domain-containing protein n=1 Tax=Paramarasmius palmivorus TaxID=297713 RepID=A0AAW0BJ27_9AGAR